MSLPIYLIAPDEYRAFLAEQSTLNQNLLARFDVKPGQHGLLHNASGELEGAFLVFDDPWQVGSLPKALPVAEYHIENIDEPLAYIAWGLSAYRFDRYQDGEPMAQLNEQPALLQPIHWARDVINTPTEDMGVSALEKAITQQAETLGAEVTVVCGEALLAENYPLIHAVGRSGAEAPRLLEIEWGDPAHPSLAIVGKGVCYDTGGLSLKPTPSMLKMKKDMAGSAHAFALAWMIMQASLPWHVKVYLPLVENGIGPNAIRPGDVVRSRKGSFVEITNTDAEGRLIMADCLTRAIEDAPDLLLDFATLTGGSAVGPDMAALMSNNQEWAMRFIQAGEAQHDPIVELPLYPGYAADMESPIADIANATSKRYAATIHAGLFLQHFVPDSQAWVHLDIVAFNEVERPAKPMGADVQAVRAIFKELS